MIIAIAHNKGGVGKTTLAVNLAEIIKPVFMVDQDTHTGLSLLNNLRVTDPFDVRQFDTTDEMIAQLQPISECPVRHVIIDCGGFDSDMTRTAVALADVVVVPANDHVTEMIGLWKFNTVLSEISTGMERHIIGHVFMSKVHPSRQSFGEAKAYIKGAKHLRLASAKFPRREAYPEALSSGEGIAGPNQHDSPYTVEVKRLAKEILTIHESASVEA
jgi:chromosome partitioning protein